MTDTATVEAPAATVTLPLSRIRPGGNPRRFFSPSKHAELVASLQLRGMLQPIMLRYDWEADMYPIVAGERRYRAALEAFGPEGSVPVIVRANMSDQEALEAAIDENDVREDASETEQADAAVRILAACKDDRAEAAKRLGWSPSKLDRRLALAGLSDAVKSALDERRIKVGHAELLAAVPADKQDKALDTIQTHGLDVAKTRELLMRVTQDLASATFDKTECASCGYNSARQCALFETHVDDGHCTNGACFALKVEAAAEAASAAKSDCEAASHPITREATVSGGADGSNPDSSPVPSAEQGSTPTRPATTPAPAKPKVTTQSLRDKLLPVRNAAWRNAVAEALRESGDHLRVADIAAQVIKDGATMDLVHKLADEFEVDLRATWRVNGNFLAQLSKDELKFVALECALVGHMGEKAFAKLLSAPASDLITGILHVTGFDWSGRLPGAMTLDGQYGPPIADPKAKD